MTDTDDIVERLRNPRWTVGGRDVLDDMDEAADEIEPSTMIVVLNRLLQKKEAEIERLRAECVRCGVEYPDSPYEGWPWQCTRVEGHAGPHVATTDTIEWDDD